MSRQLARKPPSLFRLVARRRTSAAQVCLLRVAIVGVLETHRLETAARPRGICAPKDAAEQRTQLANKVVCAPLQSRRGIVANLHRRDIGKLATNLKIDYSKSRRRRPGQAMAHRSHNSARANTFAQRARNFDKALARVCRGTRNTSFHFEWMPRCKSPTLLTHCCDCRQRVNERFFD